MTPREIYDSQLLRMIEAWADLHDQMERHAMFIPQYEIDEWDEEGVKGADIIYNEMLEDLADGMLKAARKLVSEADDAGLLCTDDWRVINLILYFAGTDEPLSEVLYPYMEEEADYDNHAF